MKANYYYLWISPHRRKEPRKADDLFISGKLFSKFRFVTNKFKKNENKSLFCVINSACELCHSKCFLDS